MQLAVTVVSPEARRRADVLIDAAPETPVTQIATELDHVMHGAAVSRVPVLFVGGHRVPGDMRLADAPVLDGGVISLGDPAGCLRPESPGAAELRVAGGPAAGAVHALGFGAADVGGAGPGEDLVTGSPDVVIGDPAIPPLALRVIIGYGGGQVAPYDGAHVLLDGQPLDQAAYWRPGQQIAVGDTLLDLVPFEPPDAALHPAEDGAGLDFNRPPRLLPPGGTMRFQLPSPPGKPERRPVPVLMAVVPVVLGVAMTYFLRQVYMLALAVFSPVMLLGSYVSDRRHGRKSHVRQQAEYREHKARVERDAADAADAERLRRPAEGQNCAVLIGNDAETVAARIAELQAIIAARQKASREQGQGRFGPHLMVVWDGSRRLRSLPGVVSILREGPQVGMYSICLDSDERLLPAECQAVAAAGPDGALTVGQMNEPAIGQVRPEYVTPGWAERLARSIAPIRDISGNEEDAGLPGTCRLLDVLGLEPPDAGAITAGWQAGGRSTQAVIGACYDGPFGIDLARDGPHALIAGTTGAGKSELLQTLVASLSLVNRPDAMTFVLVDYKGGSAFKDCVHLPHVTGMVTDLDAHLTQRALASLSAELTRRERVLAAAGAKDIEEYTERAGREPRCPLLPRLVIVIDEFASLARDLPDFVTGLVGIAQRGRSLGIHLILATQRPSGVVSADIRANTNLRIALRMTDAAESADVIDAPDAARIARGVPGRGYVRLGHASLVPFQAARIGGRRPGAGTPGRPRVAPLHWSRLGRPEPRRPKDPAPRQADGEALSDEAGDLKVLVGEIQRAAAGLRIPAQPSPWLPPLPRTLLLRDLPGLGRQPRPGQAPVPFGLIDLPGRQRQQPAVIGLESFGHLMAAGAPRSGRSQLLRTVAAAVAVGFSCADVHPYGLDCGNGALLPLADLPHCGAVVTRTQDERAARLLARLAAELSRRQDLPAGIPPGRAFRAGAGTETQVALLAPDPSGQAQATALRQTADWAEALDAAVPGSRRPFRVDRLPSRITFAEAWNLRPRGASPLWGLADVGGDELTALGPDLSDGMPAFIVAGPARSGRSSVLLSMTRAFLSGGAQVILVTARPSPLRSLAGSPGVTCSFEQSDLGQDELAAALAALTGPGVVVIDDADLLADCEADRELSKIITRSGGRSLGLILAADPDTLASGFAGWLADARRARRGCLTAPQTLPEGDLVGARLSHAHLGHPIRPGRALLNTGDGTLAAITVPAG